MSVKTVLNEIEGIVYRSTEQLLQFNSGKGRAGSELRLLVGDIRANCNKYVLDGSFGQRLLNVYTGATKAGISVDWMDNVLKQLIKEKPSNLSTVSVVQSSILFALAQDGRILKKTEFRSRQEVEEMLERMKKWFDIAKDLASEQRDNPIYNSLNTLGGAIARYMADTARPLPRMLEYTLIPQPTLSISQYIYHDGTHSEDIISENKIVHPAFCPENIRAISPIA